MSNNNKKSCDDPSSEEQEVQVSMSDYFINGDINPQNVKPVIDGIIAANADLGMYELRPNEVLAPIRIFINSGGGNLDDGFALISVMKASLIPIVTVALGECSSSALMIAMSGDYRFVSKYCGILSHQYSMAIGPVKHVDMKAKARDIDLTAQKIIDLYTEQTELSEEEIGEHLLKPYDVYLTPEECIEFNIFDGYFESFGQIVQLTYSEETNDNEAVKKDD